MRVNDTGEKHLARALHVSLLFLIAWGILTHMIFRFDPDPTGMGSPLTILMVVSFGLSFFLNRSHRFIPALILAIVTLTAATFALTLVQAAGNDNSASTLYYLVIVILMSELFLPTRGFILVISIVFAGLLGIQLWLQDITTVLLFLLTVSILAGINGHNRRLVERERLALASQSVQDQSLLLSERHRSHQMELLNQITQTTPQTSDMREALQILADQVGQIMEADGTFITLWDENTNRVFPASAYGEFRNIYPNMHIQPGENTLTESVLRESRAIPVEDVRNTPYMSPRLATEVPTQSVLALPLIANERKLGAAIISYDQHHRFTPEEIAMGEQVARQIALSIFKAQLYDKERHRATQLELLEEVGRRIADSFDEMEILQRALDAVVDKFGYAEAAISLLTDDDYLEVAAITGTQDFGYRPGFRQEVGKGIIGHVAQTRTSYIASDVSDDPYYFSTARRDGSAAGIPIFDKDQLLGVIYVESIHKGDFNTDDVKTLQTLANQVATSLQRARLHANTQEHLSVMTTLQSVSQVVIASLDLHEICRNVIELLQHTFGYGYISIYLLEDETLRLGAELGYPPELIIHEISTSTGIIGRTVRTKKAQFIRDVTTDPAFLRAAYEVKSEICVPLLKKNNVLGVLNVESVENRPLTESDVNLLNALAAPLAIAIDNARLHAEVKMLALTDPLTGLANRRAFDEILHTELTRADRYKNPLSLIILDLDSFKEFNDHYGHPAGDVRLKEIGEMLQQNVREPDIAARYGGEEFAVILPSTNKEGALKLADRLRKAAEAKAPDHKHSSHTIPGYTISLGVASFPDDAITLDNLLLAADNAELTAKRLGKNRVHAADSLTQNSN